MEYGHIVLAATSGEFTASAIKWFTNSRFSHSLITVPSQLGMEMCVEASGKGIDELEFDKGYRSNTTQSYMVFELNVPQEVKNASLVSVFNELEGSYGYLAYPWFIFRTLMWRIFKKDIKSQNNWYTNEYVCSGLVRLYLDSEPMREYLKSKGIDNLFDGYGVGAVVPEDLLKIFNANPTIFNKIESKGF